MRMKPNEIERLAKRIIHLLTGKQLFTPKVAETVLIKRVIDIFTKNMEEEESIEQETRRMMTQYEAQIRSGEVDAHRMHQMIRNKIAKERKFVL
jgi:hypothetical protein